jgi:hypothetical protein
MRRRINLNREHTRRLGEVISQLVHEAEERQLRTQDRFDE